jgi:hypothetical protein
MKFDAVKGCAVPIDLTGAKIEYRIYKPRYSVNITLNSPGLDEPIKHTLDLTEEQSFAVAELKTDAERISYINSVILERRKEISDIMAATLNERTKALDRARG